MTEKEAVDLLKHHSFTHDDIKNHKSRNGFIGMLRPFQGKLYESNFYELMGILKVLRHSFDKENTDRQLISDFWRICHLSRAWGLEQEGMLRSNHLMSDNQIELLTTWTDCISYTVMNLLDGLPDKEAFESYTFYSQDKGNDVTTE